LAALGGVLFYTQASQAQDNKPCNSNSEQCMISAANTYLDALISHDATHIRLAPDARRTLQGDANVTDGAQAIRDSLTPPTGDQFNIGIRDLRWFVDKPNHEAVAFYLLDVGNTIPPTTVVATVHITERFKVDNGLITEIEGIFTTGAANGGSGWPAPTA
jgi:3'(2'), 5'-bisphosphate nucleotidase